MKKIFLIGALAAAQSLSPIAVQAQGAAPAQAEAPLLSAGPVPAPQPVPQPALQPAPGAPPTLGLVPPPPPGGFTTPAEQAPQPSATPRNDVPTPVSVFAPPPAMTAPTTPVAPPPAMTAPQPPVFAPPMAPSSAPSLAAPSLPTPSLPPGPPVLSGPTAPAKGYPTTAAAPAKMDQRTAAVLREAIRGVAALREIPDHPVSDARLRKMLDIGHQACRLANIARFPIMPRFQVRTDDTVLRNRSHGTFEYRKFGAFQTRLDGWVRPVSRFVHCNLHFVARGKSSVLIKGVVTRGADLDTDLEIQAGDAFGRMWKLVITSRGLLLRDDGLPAGGSLTIAATDPGNRTQQVAWQFPIEEAWKKPEIKPALRKQDGAPVAIPPEPWQLRDAPKAAVRAAPTITPVPAAPCPVPDGQFGGTPAPTQDAGMPKQFRPRDVVPAGYDDPNSPNILPQPVNGEPVLPMVPVPAPTPAPAMSASELPAPVLAQPAAPSQCPQPPQEQKDYRHRKKPRHW